MALALPKLRWLIIGAIAAGVWVVREDMKNPRPPERVPSRIERQAEAKLRPPERVAVKSDTTKPSTKAVAGRLVPPRPVTGRPAPQKAAPQNTALLLPKTVIRPPAKPQRIANGSITRPDKPTFLQTRAKVHVRAQARADAPVIATLQPRTVMRELARTGDWRLIMGDGRKGWVRADSLAEPTFLPRRPKLPVAEVNQATASR
ncbi:MAG: SH3 domain-containing protein [Pseudomonadota bacterium]|nr:SH3 domain-containing protein [Pseudomonadota bacterium]